jgi:periplasmic protein TonB
MSTYRLPLPPNPAPQNRAQVVATSAGPAAGAARKDTFLDAMLDMPATSGPRSRNPLKMVASVLIHAGVIALLIIVPLYFAKNTLDLQKLTATYVFTPPPPAPPPPPAATKAPETPKVTPKIVQPTFVAPKVVPKEVQSAPPPAAAAPDVNAGVLGGVPGGVPGGVLGGLIGGTGTGPAPPAPAAKAPGIVRVGGDVKAPQLVDRVNPEYPQVAKMAHVQGTVVIDAVIDKSGAVVSEHAVSGPGLLVPAALDAVKQWKYKPTYLNGEAVDLAMQVTVNFQLGMGA